MNTCEHEWGDQSQVCKKCGQTLMAVLGERDRSGPVSGDKCTLRINGEVVAVFDTFSYAPTTVSYDKVYELPPRLYYFDSVEEAFDRIEAAANNPTNYKLVVIDSLPFVAEKKCGCGTGTMSPKHADYCDLYAPED